MSKNLFLKRFFVGEYTNRKFILLSIIVISFLTIELIVSNVSQETEIVSPVSTVGFIVITLVYVLAQYFILEYVRRKSAPLRVRSTLIRYLDNVVFLVQYSIVALPILIIVQILINGNYYTALITWCISVNYILSITVIMILSLRFLLWYKSKRNYVVLLYGLSSIAIMVRVAITLIFYVLLLLGVSPERNMQSEVFLQDFEPDSILGLLNNAYTTSSSVAFMLMWIATAILLHHYYYKSTPVRYSSHIKYWLLVAIIPAYSLSDYFISDVIIPISIGFDNVNYQIFIAFQGLGAGILLSIPFWIMARSVKGRSGMVRDYLTISAIGIILFFTASSVTIDHAPFPPYGLILILSLGLSSYMILVGLYSSAISVSYDRKLSSFIRKYAINQSRLLDSIGSADLYQQLEKKVEEKLDEFSTLSGVEPTINDNDIKAYLENIIEEIRKPKKKS